MLNEAVLGYKSSWRILSLLLETPRKPVSRRELFQHTRLGNAPLSQGLNRLVKAGLVIREKKGKKEVYYPDTANDYLKLVKELWEREKKDTRNLEYKIKIVVSEFLRMVLDILEVQKVVLFGSHAKGTASENSDIDLAVVFRENLGKEIEITRIIKNLESKFDKRIQGHFFTEKSFSQKTKLTAEIKRNGIEVI